MIGLRVLVLLALFCADASRAEVLSGSVVAIADGDTLTVLDSAHVQHKIRVAGIDAPEKRQPFGNRSRQSLGALAFGRVVAVDWKKYDRYGRIIGLVRVNGLDVGLEQVKRGMAWHYKQYEREQTAEDRVSYAEAEAVARANHVGLWSEPNPVPPWDFRHRGRR